MNVVREHIKSSSVVSTEFFSDVHMLHSAILPDHVSKLVTVFSIDQLTNSYLHISANTSIHCLAFTEIRQLLKSTCKSEVVFVVLRLYLYML